MKLYGDDPRLEGRPADARYNPGQYIMTIQRFTRLTNAFRKKIENHEAAVALHYGYYNWCRMHQTLRVTPAMEAGLADHVWTLEELVGILEQDEAAKITAGAMKRGPYRPKDSK